MSAQSIVSINENYICKKIDDYLISEGKYFMNMIEYDLKGSINYEKLDTVLWLKKLSEKCDDKEILIIIDKILK